MGSRESRRQQPSRKSRRLEEIQRRQSQDQGQATLQPAVSVRGPLSEKNLRAHNESLEMIRGRKRKQSLLPIDTETTSVQSQKSSGTASWYRWTTLRNAKVFFRGWPPPKDIQDQINAIVEKASPMERKDSLASITETLCKNFAKVLNRASMEDDCVEIFYNALSFMNQLEHLALSRKAGISPIPLTYILYAYLIQIGDLALNPTLLLSASQTLCLKPPVLLVQG
jgi:hypothetical protein